jgi:glyceraldehyde 3-phosphate dehydrogenase
MASLRVGINGFGRIGRHTLQYLRKMDNVEVVAVNDLTDPATLAHLLKWDSVHGRYPEEVTSEGDCLHVGGQPIRVKAEKDPAQLAWGELGVDVVLECTGRFRDAEGLHKHIAAGARKALLSAPAKGEVKTVVLGVNDGALGQDDLIASNASCTTNCLAPMIKVLDDAYGLEEGYMSTIHAYTADQNTVDGPHKDLRRARTAAINIIPTTTGAAAAVGKVLPHLKGKLDGMAFRVPVAAGSITDVSARLKRMPAGGIEEVNRLFREAAEGTLRNIMEYSEEPLVSTDIVGNPHSVIFDAQSTKVGQDLVKVVGWYDNESGYAARLADMAVHFGRL